MKENFELRMYFFVPYNLSPMQKALQAGHAALEYADKYGGEELFVRFVRDWKTWIILDGGTTNSKRNLDGIVYGTLDQIGDSLLENDIQFSYFKEPDLNDALTAICFIADERVFNKEIYPDFINYLLNINENNFSTQIKIIELRMTAYETLIDMFPTSYNQWLELIGGKQNVFLRELLKDKHLA